MGILPKKEKNSKGQTQFQKKIIKWDINGEKIKKRSIGVIRPFAMKVNHCTNKEECSYTHWGYLDMIYDTKRMHGHMRFNWCQVLIKRNKN